MNDQMSDYAYQDALERAKEPNAEKMILDSINEIKINNIIDKVKLYRKNQEENKNNFYLSKVLRRDLKLVDTEYQEHLAKKLINLGFIDEDTLRILKQVKGKISDIL